MASVSLAPEWRPKKRLIPNQLSSSRTKKKRRVPSYIDTQVNDVGYKKLKSMCDRLCKGLSSSDDGENSHTASRFEAEFENFVASVGLELLERMEKTKKLAQLVIDEIKNAKRCLSTTFTSVDTDYLFCMFPEDARKSDYSAYKASMARFVQDEQVKAREARRIEDEKMAERGEFRVAWDDDL